uniref:Uncharacterized protein n=1 Tax=Arundo donax TaxID=35708 RepID=A0A0A9E4T7_ARUDO
MTAAAAVFGEGAVRFEPQARAEQVVLGVAGEGVHEAEPHRLRVPGPRRARRPEQQRLGVERRSRAPRRLAVRRALRGEPDE